MEAETGQMSEGPFTDDMIRHYMLAAQTQQGIIKYAEAMAQVLAEAGRASHKATGDSPQVAVLKWITVIQKRALELLHEDSQQRALPHPSIEVEK